MEKIAIITDSASDIKENEIDKNIVRILPLQISFSDGDYKDGVTISSAEVYEKMDVEIPKTSLPNGNDMTNAIEELINEGFTHILGIFISSGLSGTANSFRNIAEEYADKVVIETFDTKNLSVAETVHVVDAQRLIKEGKPFDEIVSTIKSKMPRINTYFVLDTLEYLVKGGRIGKVSGTIGQLLNIKPIIHVNEEGIYHTVDKARGKKQSLSKLIEHIKSTYLEKGKCNIFLVHGGVENEGLEFMEQLKSANNVNFIDLRPLTPALSVHTGKGLIGVIIEEL